MRNYNIITIKNYPDDGKHQVCNLDIPIVITKGEDPFHWIDNKGVEHLYGSYTGKVDERWICYLYGETRTGINPSLKKIWENKVNKDLDKIVDYCLKVYRKSLALEMDRLIEIEKEFIISE